MRKFEYKVFSFTNLIEQKLNVLGQEGWELVSVYLDGPYHNCYFKREIAVSNSQQLDDGYRGDPSDPRYKNRY